MPANKKTIVKPETIEHGVTGTQVIGGYIQQEEFNLSLSEDKAIETYDKMRRTDGQVNAVISAEELPLRSATWRVEPASKDNADQVIAQFVEGNLFHNDNFTWDDSLRQILRYLQFGFYPFEKVFEVRDNKFQLKKIAPRKPTTIRKWNQGKDGTLVSIEQFASKPDGQFGTMTIPNDYLLLFSNDREGNNYRGTSVLRNIYRNWLLKERLMKIDAMRHERMAIGVPWMKLLEGYTEADETAAEKVGETFRAHEKAYVVTTPFMDFSLVDMKASGTSNPLLSIRYHNQEMTSSILAQFLDLGKTETGSRAVASELKDIFLLALMSVAKYICDTINEGVEGRRLVRDLVDYNFNNVSKYPKLTCTKIEQVDFVKLSSALMNLANAQFIEADDESEKWIREIMGMPEKTTGPDARKPLPPQIKTPAGGENPDEEIPGEMHAGHRHVSLSDARKPGQYWRPLTAIEKRIGLTAIDMKLGTFKAKLIAVGDRYRSLMINDLAAAGTKILAGKGRIADIQQAMDKITVPARKPLEKDLASVLSDVFRYGRDTLISEMRKARVELADPLAWDEDEAERAAELYAGMAAGSLVKKLLDETKKMIVQQRLVGDVDKYEIKDRLQALTANDFADQMQRNINKTFGLGRDSEAMKNEDKILRVLRTEVMDEATCGPCERLDAESMASGGFDLNDPIVDDFIGGPYIDCEGGDRCRGMNIYEFKGSEQ